MLSSRARVDYNVIDVDTAEGPFSQPTEGVLHEPLECGWRFSKPKGHYSELVKAINGH